MKERPILFSAPMVRAILEGRKTQTRRIFDPLKFKRGIGYSGGWRPFNPEDKSERESLPTWCPYGDAGEDRLWVKETFQAVYDCQDWDCECRDGTNEHRRVVYRATEPDGISGFCRGWEDEREAIWRPSIFMPRWASRITLEVTGVRVERLHEISEDDAKAEGAAFFDGRPVNHHGWRHDNADVYATARASFAALWCSINGAESWAANPWVWVVEFKRVEAKSVAA